MPFEPSIHSYGGWYEDAKAAVEARYDAVVSSATSARDAAVSVALAPVRAATAAATAAQSSVSKAAQAAADIKAAADATRDAASNTVPWVVGGLVVLGGLWAYRHNSRRSRSNPSADPDAWNFVPTGDTWLRVGASGVTSSVDSGVRALREVRSAKGLRAKAAAASRGAGRGLVHASGVSSLPRLLNLLGFAV